MKKVSVYDIPLRLFHGLFAFGSLVVLFIAKVLGEHSPQFPIHMILGLCLVFMVVLRLLWGIVGTKWSRFSSFQLHPTALVCYFKDLMLFRTSLSLGHNPASSWAALVMFGLVLGLGVTGYLMGSGQATDIVEEAHELFANLFIVTIVAHVAGVMIHTLRHKDALPLSMVHGKKLRETDSPGISSSRPIIGLLFLVSVIWFGNTVFSNYNAQAKTLTLFGQTLQLDEEGHGDTGHVSEHSFHEDDDDD